MKAQELIQFIEKEAHPLVNELMAELRTNLGTSHYRRLKDEELDRRVSTVYLHLREWLATKDELAIQKAGEELGQRRFAEGIPLGQVVMALILEEKRLVDFLRNSGVQADEALWHAITEFYQKTIYHTALGYEAALAKSNRLARRAVVSPAEAEPAAAKPEVGKEEPDLEISRGGQVGEFGG